MGHPVKGSFRQAVLASVLGGTSTIDEVILACGGQVSASRAINAARTMQKAEQKYRNKLGYGRRVESGTNALIQRGRRRVVQQELHKLQRVGLIHRLSPGVYGPPLPKLHQPDQQAG